MTTVDILYPNTQATEVLRKQGGGEHPLRYLCKICCKRFVSGRALGGHMRAHAPSSMAADTLTETEFEKSKRPRASDDKSMEEKDEEEGLDGNGSNLMYALRKNPKRSWRFEDRDYSLLLGNRLNSKPIASSIECHLHGKEFNSWKGLFSQMKCHSEIHQESSNAHLEESQKHETQDEEEEGSETDAETEIEIEVDHPGGNSRKFEKWMKGKRSKRPRYALQLNPDEQFSSVTNNEEEDLAMCLLMLANGVNTAQNPQFQRGSEKPGSVGELKLPNNGSQLPKCIRKKPKAKKIDGDSGLYDDEEAKNASYECTTCHKLFHSYQALGGHRASHSKVKGCLQIEEENGSMKEEITDEEHITVSDSQLPGDFHKPSPKERTLDSCAKAKEASNETRTIEPAAFSGKKSRIHECSICHRVFALGQALGGHMRSHWGSAEASDSVNNISSNKETTVQQQKPARVELLDLNLPAPVDDDCDAGNLNNLGGNAVDSQDASSSYCQTQSPPYLQPCLMGSYPKQGLLLYNSNSRLSKDDEADSNTGKEIRFGRECASDFPVRAQSWFQL